MSKSRNFFGQPCKETHSEAVVSRFSSADSQRPSGGGHVAIGRWPLEISEKNGNHRGKNEKSRLSSIPLPGICRPMLVRKGSRYSQKKVYRKLLKCVWLREKTRQILRSLS